MKICKQVWHNHVLKAYCSAFEDSKPSDTTATSNSSVTCKDCLTLIELEKEVLQEVMA